MKIKILSIFICMALVITSSITVAIPNLEKEEPILNNYSNQNDCTTLIAESGHVIEINSSGDIIWELLLLDPPADAERLNNGNTLVADQLNGRVIEVDTYGTIVWEKSGLNIPGDAERLSNGNTLICELYNERVIEVDANGAIVWEKSGLNGPIDAERLDNGNTLIAEANSSHVIEVDTYWQYCMGNCRNRTSNGCRTIR